MTAALRMVAALFERSRTGVGCALDVSIHDAAFAWSLFPTTDDLAQPRYNLYETSDGRWLALGGLEKKFWNGFCERIGVPVTATIDHVRTVMRTRTRDGWLAAFADADVCLTTVYTPAEAAVDPHVLARGLRSTPGRLAPALGADTDELLEGAGISTGERVRLRAAGVI
jgi:alpha-methylacyl-CoA racemase